MISLMVTSMKFLNKSPVKQGRGTHPSAENFLIERGTFPPG